MKPLPLLSLVMVRVLLLLLHSPSRPPEESSGHGQAGCASRDVWRVQTSRSIFVGGVSDVFRSEPWDLYVCPIKKCSH
ncbi:hypothetical protein FKM82_021470, partial [Ascaphus truei]